MALSEREKTTFVALTCNASAYESTSRLNSLHYNRIVYMNVCLQQHQDNENADPVSFIGGQQTSVLS